MFTAPF